MVQQDDKTKLDMPANIKKDVSIFTKALDSGNYSVSFYFPKCQFKLERK